MNRADQHLEFAHIYADTDLGLEQIMSVLHAKQIARGFQGRTVSAILIDDLHIDRATLDIREYVAGIQATGVKVDHVAFESRFDVIAEQIIDMISPESLSLETFRKSGKTVLNLVKGDRRIGLRQVNGEGQVHTCALLSAAWTLCRLGVFEFPHNSIVSLTDAPLYAHNVVSVLDVKYEPVEGKVRDIISAAGLGHKLDRFAHVFYQ